MVGRAQWLEDASKKRVESAIVEAEAKTSAEFVVTVRASSGRYMAAPLIFGALVAFVGLCVYVYHPTQFTDDLVPPVLAMMFVVSALFSSQLGWLKRVMTPKKVREENVRRAALEAFYEQGISVTKDRTGVLVYVSLLEGVVEVVPDVGVDVDALGEEGARAIAGLKGAVRTGGVDALTEGLSRLSDALGRTLPRAEDDVNELPDAVT